MPAAAQPPRRLAIATTLALTVLALVGLNAVKPLHIDDPFIYRIAERIVQHPLDPYGFEIHWLQWPQPVSEELTPPVLPYWWSAALALFGDRPTLWKLWLTPFAALLVLALHDLLRRFAPETTPLGVPLLVLSPVVLPGFNLMQDVPATALGLAGLALYFRAAESARPAPALALAAGLFLGLATQTKFTMLTLLPLVLLHVMLVRRRRAGLIALGVAAGLFAAWELIMTGVYGQGMFLGQVQHGQFWVPRVAMVLHLLRLFGGGAAVLAAVATWTVGPGGRAWVVPAAVLVVLATLAPALGPWGASLFPWLGGAVLGPAAFVAWRSVRPRAAEGAERWIDPFLVTWCVIELAGYFGTAPFPAVRRILGPFLAIGLLLLRAGVRRHGREGWRRVAPVLVATSALLGLGVWGVDCLEAFAQRRGAREAARVVRSEDPGARIWFLGHWGFQYYAERAGMVAVVPDRSVLQAGDWLAVPSRVDRQSIALRADQAVLRRTLDFDDGVPLGTNFGYYGGSRPLTHVAGPRLTVDLFRIARETVPPTDWPVPRIVDWARTNAPRTGAAAVPALRRVLREDPRADARRLAILGLAQLGPFATAAVDDLIRALDDPAPAVVREAVIALGRIGPVARVAVPRLVALAAEADEGLRLEIESTLRAIDAAPAL